MIQWQLDLGPVGLVFEFVITVIVIAVASWLLFKKRSSVLWKQTDYAYLIFTIVGGIVAAADLSISSWSKELQQNKIIIDETSSHLRDYVDSGVNECNILNAQRDAANARRDDQIGGIIRQPNIEPVMPVTPYAEGFVKLHAGKKLWALSSPQFVQSDCTFLQDVSTAIKSNDLGVMMLVAKFHFSSGDSEKTSKDVAEAITSEIEDINKYSDRSDELEASLSALKPFSLLKAMSPMLLGLGVGIRLARTHFDVKTEQEKQRREATAISPPIDATTVGEAQD